MMRLLLLLISLALTAQVVYSAPIASVDLEHLSARNKEVGKTAPTGGPRGESGCIRSSASVSTSDSLCFR